MPAIRSSKVLVSRSALASQILRATGSVNLPEAFLKFCAQGTVPGLRLCRALGVDPNSRDVDDYTGVMLAAIHDHPPAIVTLSGMGARLNDQVNGWNAVKFAIQSDRPRPVMTLYKLGADMNQTDRLGRSNRDIARQFKAEKALKVLDEIDSLRTAPTVRAGLRDLEKVLGPRLAKSLTQIGPV